MGVGGVSIGAVGSGDREDDRRGSGVACGVDSGVGRD